MTGPFTQQHCRLAIQASERAAASFNGMTLAALFNRRFFEARAAYWRKELLRAQQENSNV